MKNQPVWLLGLWLSLVALAASLLLFLPDRGTWGEQLGFDPTKGADRLFPDKPIQQTFVWENDTIDLIVLWVQPDSLPKQGRLQLAVYDNQRKKLAQTQLDIGRVTHSGLALFQMNTPITGKSGRQGEFELTLLNTKQSLKLQIQIDGSIYPEGSLRHRAADLAFQVHYRQPALGNGWLAPVLAALIFMAGSLAGLALYCLKTRLRDKIWHRSDLVMALLAGISVAFFYGFYLLRSGSWIAPGDFVKDVSYLEATAQSVAARAWPVWNHLICGGAPLLANPESNGFSLAGLFRLFTNSERALLLTLVAEAGIGAAGFFLLGRRLAMSCLASLIVAFIATLSAPLAYHWGEGFSMSGAAFAYAPWIFIGYIIARDKSIYLGSIISGLALGLQFLRGEVHLLVVTLGLIGLSWVLEAWRNRSYRKILPQYQKATRVSQWTSGLRYGVSALPSPVLQETTGMSPWSALLILLMTGSIAFITGAPKLLAYLEHRAEFATNLPPHVVRLIDQELVPEIFLQSPDRSHTVTVQNGSQEQWGNVGAYTGLLPWLLAAVGFWPAFKRWPGLAVGFVSLAGLIEGTLYDKVLRHAEILQAILRMPSRLLPLLVVLLGLLAGFGLDTLRHQIKKGGLVLGLIIIGTVLFLDWSHTGTLLAKEFGRRTIANNAALVGMQDGQRLPNICADFLRPPQDLNENNPEHLTMASATFSPNLIQAENNQSEFLIQTTYSDAWQAPAAVVMPYVDGWLRIIPQPDAPEKINLVAADATGGAQKTLLVLAVLFILTLITKSILDHRTPSY